jgi:hypothetical protein
MIRGAEEDVRGNSLADRAAIDGGFTSTLPIGAGRQWLEFGQEQT